MKKILYIVLILLFTTACSSEELNSLKEENHNLVQQVQTLEDELKSNLSEIDSLKNQLADVQLQLDKTVKETTVQDGDVTILVVDKKNTPKNTDKWIFSPRCDFEISITNNTEKAIKGIQGSLEIQDMFGVSIMNASCDIVGSVIEPNETIIHDELGLEINEFIDEHVEIYTTEFEDLKFVYTVSKIMFTDGTLKEN